jgi:hypothetical protein
LECFWVLEDIKEIFINIFFTMFSEYNKIFFIVTSMRFKFAD